MALLAVNAGDLDFQPDGWEFYTTKAEKVRESERK